MISLLSLLRGAALALLIALPAHAEDRENPIERDLKKCLEDGSSTHQMVECEDRAYKRWDEELNRVYAALGKRLAPQQKEALKKAQLQWIKTRDAEFALIKSLYDAFDGTMYQPMRVDAAKEVVRRRAEELQHYLDLVQEHGTPEEKDRK